MKGKTPHVALIALVLMSHLFFLSCTRQAAEPQATAPKEPAAQGTKATAAETAAGEAPETAQQAGVQIPSDRQQLIGMKTVEVAEGPLRLTIRTVGRVEYNERALSTVNLKVEGWVDRLYADYTGKRVKKGEPLAEIYSLELYANQMEYLNLMRWRKDRSHRFQREIEFSWSDRFGPTGKMQTGELEPLVQVARQRLKLWDLTDEQIKDIEEKNEPLRTFTVYSPSNGYIVQKPAVRGTRLGPGEKLVDIADLSSVWVIADIYEYELPFVKVGQPAKIELSYIPGREFASKIDYIYPALSEKARTARVRFVIPNEGAQLKPRMFTNVVASLDAGRGLIIPEDAVMDTGSRRIVYVDKGDGLFEPRQVTLGLRTEGMVQVTRGLAKGERVVSAANFMIDSEAKLKGIVTE